MLVTEFKYDICHDVDQVNISVANWLSSSFPKKLLVEFLKSGPEVRVGEKRLRLS